jgi:hypothetical protein
MGLFRRLTISAAAVIGCTSLSPALCAEDKGGYKWQRVESKMRLAAREDAQYEVDGSDVRLKAGALMLDAFAPVTLKLPLATVQPKARSLVFVRARPGCEHVFVLLGNAPVTVGRHRTMLSTGEEAVITDHQPDYKDLVGEDDIGRRRLRLTPLPENKTFVLSEFSLIQAVEREPLIYALIHSGETQDRALKARLMKMAAVLNIVTGRHGQYTTGLR